MQDGGIITASTQKFEAMHPIISVNATRLIVYPFRNSRDIGSFLEEVSGFTGKKELLSVYKVTADEFGVLYVSGKLIKSARRSSTMIQDGWS